MAKEPEVKPAEPEPIPVPKAKAKEAFTLTVVLDDGKRVASRIEGAVKKAQDAAHAAAKDGYDSDEDGVWVHYPARRITKVTVQAATE